MGTTFTTLHVRCGQAEADTMRQRLVDALRARVLTEGFVEAAADAPTADRVIRVGPAENAGWITVDGALTRGLDHHALQTCAQELSATLATAVLVASVAHSDRLEIWLYRQGTLVDHYNSDPSAVSPSLPQRRWKEVAGHAQQWADLLLPPASPTILQALFDSRPIFAEDTFYALVPFLGINPRWCAGLEPDADVLPLRFQSSAVPHYRTPIQGAPRLLLQSHPLAVTGMVGHRIEVTWMMRSAGGPGYGLVVSMSGTALATGLLRLESLSTWIADPERPQQFDHPLQDYDPRQAVTVEFSDLLLPPDRIGSRLRPEAWNWRTILRDQAHASIVVRATATVLAVGEGRLHLKTNLLTGGEATTTLELPCVTHPAARSPLRVADRSALERPGLLWNETLAIYLLKLNTPRILQAHLVLPPTTNASAAFLAAFERWHAALDPDPRAYYAIAARTTLDQRSQTTRMRPRTIPKGKRWERLRRTLQAAQAIQIQLDDPPTSSTALDPDDLGETDYGPPRPSAGGKVEQMSVFLEHVPDAVAPQLNLWVDLRHAPPARQAYLVAQLTALMDSLFASNDGVQAYLARWMDPPYDADSTPYELVCGIHGQITMSHTWCAQFLRAVTERMWLGPALLARLQTPDALADHATVTPVGNGLRVTVASSTQLDALEAILAPLLPSESDWHQAVDALYAERRAQHPT